MTDIEFLKEKGFQILPGEQYDIVVRGMDVFLENTEGNMTFRCCCGSTKVDHEKEISDQIAEAAEDDPRLEGCFRDRWLTMEIVCEDPEEERECVEKALEIIKAVFEKYDMVPACAVCKRLAPVEIHVGQEGAVMICGVCRDQGRLLEKHEKMVREYHNKAAKSKKAGIEWGPCKVLFFAGLQIGLISGVVAVLLFMAGFAIPIIGMLPWIPGSIGGYNVMSSAVKVQFMPLIVRFLIASCSFLLLLLLILFVAYFIIIGTLGNYVTLSYFHILVGFAVGGAGYLLAAAVGYLLNPDL